jgi:hypothetical protein
MNTTAAPSPPQTPANTQPWRTVLAWVAVGLTPVSLIVGFVLGYAFGLDPSIVDPLTGWNAAWRVVLLWLIVVAFSLSGLLLAWSARTHGERTATAALVANGVVFTLLTFMTLVAGLLDAFR